VANNNYPQITSVTSEALQAQIRNLLPSQEGFGTDLMAQNVIVPIIDLTSAAEGSSVPQNLQTALAFGSQTAFSALNSTAVIANSPGFYKIVFGYSLRTTTPVNPSVKLTMSDGLSVKTIWSVEFRATTQYSQVTDKFELTVFLGTGESISAVSNDAQCPIIGSSRQIADVNGVLVNPSGFTPQ